MFQLLRQLLVNNGGGLIKMPPECAKNKQEMGKGYTVYFWVDSIEEVCVTAMEGVQANLLIQFSRLLLVLKALEERRFSQSRTRARKAGSPTLSILKAIASVSTNCARSTLSKYGHWR